jgi:hypothetical protein
MNNNNGHIKPINLKLPKEVHEKFKEITHQNKASMQDVLFALVNSYIEHPEIFQFKMEIKLS